MHDLGILYLPSGPGLSSAPAREFLGPLFARVGRTVFWDEPSVMRGNPPPEGDLPAWKALVASLVTTTRSFSTPFVIVTESFGAILAETLYRELEKSGETANVAGILHTPPTVDLFRVFRRSLEMGEADFHELGDENRRVRMQGLLAELASDPRIDSPALLAGVVLAFESPKILNHYFRTVGVLMRWAGAFAQPGFAPDPHMRDRILRGLGAAKATLQTTLAPDVPTFVCAGDHDPYEAAEVFVQMVENARAVPGRKTPIAWHRMSDCGHYPYADQSARWETEVWRPFLEMVRG